MSKKLKTDLVMIIWNCAHPDEARTVIKYLLEKRLIACGNILPGMCSFYEWEGQSQESHECQVILKTRPEYFAKIEAVILEKGSYSVPEIIQISPTAVHHPYFKWVQQQT
jgi:periplasmic divalent cation tolerance protein